MVREEQSEGRVRGCGEGGAQMRVGGGAVEPRAKVGEGLW